ncbi:hypothetical protein DFH08DRAFT_799468 [Mycena albidolilacea]|uniref:Uncharacterized protein n=1 Tax=Mycena albidolilacea TaxID=1033008 RepID=A0AAD7ALM9_9AGAR|nr:hypothetical protein DFH08DRAFT_799468 [Mycena albidolilacea]
MAEINDQEECHTTVKARTPTKVVVPKCPRAKLGGLKQYAFFHTNSFVGADPIPQGPPTDPPIHSAVIRAIINQASKLIQEGQGHISNEALICQEYENCSEYNVTVHRLKHHLTIAKLLYTQQECLVALMQECKVSPVAKLLLVYDKDLSPPWLLSEDNIDALPSATAFKCEDTFPICGTQATTI